jgi:hypothetical protein
MKNRKRSGTGDPIFNPKRCLRDWDNSDQDKAYAEALSNAVHYTGNPAHKRNPGDFKLTPPAAPRQNATLCDGARVFSKVEAASLLKHGALKGLVDKRSNKGFPLLIWAIRGEDGTVFEARLENPDLGQYHGYPMPLSDPFRLVVIDGMRRR